MLKPELKINKAFKEQVESNLEKTFSSTTMRHIIKVLRKDSTCVISLMMLYENRKNVIFMLLSSVVYCIIYNYVCVGYLILQGGVSFSATSLKYGTNLVL